MMMKLRVVTKHQLVSVRIVTINVS